MPGFRMQVRRLICRIVLLVGVGMASGVPGDRAQADALDTYKALFRQALDKGAAEADVSGLRAAFVASPIYKGESATHALLAEGLLNGETDPLAGLDPDKIKSAIVRDFPLPEAHWIAFSYFKHQNPPDEARIAYHLGWYKALMASILKAQKVDGVVTTYTVLTVGEEYEVLDALDLKPNAQALVMDKGLPYDIFTFGDRTIRFDISAFFDKF